MFDLIGKTVGPYRILEQVGAGGMAIVYKAYQPNMDRYIAIKILPFQLSKDPEFAKRFQREARAIARLEHSHILPVYDYGEYEGITYIAMRYIKAGTLKDRMSTGRLSLEEINRLISQIGSALDYAHRMGVIHRDIKPANVLMDDQGDLYLSDFGLARMMEPSQQLTGSGVGLGTPAYMSPEQGQGIKIDHRSDIYSLGIILYEMLTGQVPYEAETPMAVVFKHIQGDLPLPHTISPNTPEPVERVVLKALAKDPADRYQTAGEIVQALAVATRTASKEPDEALVPAPTPTRDDVSLVTRIQRTWAQPRGKITLMGGGLAVVVILGFLLAWLLPAPIAIVEQGELMTATTIGQAASTSTVNVRPTQTTISTSTPVPTATPILPGAVLFFEDFEDGKADGLIRTGAYGKVVSDDDGNKVYEVDTTPDVGGSTIEFGSYDWTDYAVVYRVKMLNQEADIWVNFRAINQVSYIQRLSLEYSHAGLYSNVPENPWQPLAEPNYKVIQGVWYLVRIEAQGEALRVFVNDELIIERTDSKISAGNIAIGNLGNTHALFDDIVVTALGKTTNAASAPTTDAALDACVPAPEGLVGWWAGNGNTNDIIGGYHGTMVGDVTFSPGRVKQAFYFSNINKVPPYFTGTDWIRVSDNSAWDFGSEPFSIEMWVNLNSVFSQFPHQQSFISHTEGPGNTNKWVLWLQEGNGLTFHINTRSGGGFNPVTYAWNPNIGKWYHIAITRDGNNWKLFVDGQEVAMGIDGRAIPDVNSDLTIGKAEETWLEGLIDDVSIYNRALTADEVLSIYSAGGGGKCSISP